MTTLNQLVSSIRDAANYNRHDLAAPRVVLWTDGERLWSRVSTIIQDAIPELIVWDPTDARQRRGPDTLVRYLLAREEPSEIPIVYLPGISRQAFRSVTNLPDSARHLFPLQYQGQFWTQLNGKDWTPFAFLTSTEGGLTLEVARDTATKDALAEQLENVLRTPKAELTGKRLEAADFHALATSDPIRSLLQWMSAPDTAPGEWKTAEWKSFCGIAKQRFGFDPEKDGVLTAGELLATGTSHSWNDVWKRYAEAPSSWAGIRQLLAKVEAKDLFTSNGERLPHVNQAKEDALRNSLLGLDKLPYKQALAGLSELCLAHAPRVKWVWAALGESPLAHAAMHLGFLCNQAKAGVNTASWEAIAKSYAKDGWIVDCSAWKALSYARESGDFAAVTAALRAVYLPWLELLAERLAELTDRYPNSEPLDAWSLKPEPGTVVVFVDGLRYDLGSALSLLLQRRGLESTVDARWSALPTVTATAKPAWDPLTHRLTGSTISEGFEPTYTATGKPLKTPDFRSLIAEIGLPWIEGTSTGNPAQSGWTEVGSFDRYGHSDGARMAWRIEEELNAAAARIRELLKSGWKKVVVVTDHGWLLMPGGVPKVDLPKHLTLSRWGRCAVPDPGASHQFREVSWFWNGAHSVVVAPGVSAFKAGLEYVHGGRTVQEALTPYLVVTPGKAAKAEDVTIQSLKWAGLRVHVQLSGDLSEVTVDLRTKAADEGSSLLPIGYSGRVPDESGKASIAVEDDTKIGEASFLVVLRKKNVIAKQTVTIGGE